jgi:adenine-specific DNA-methyltransferase
VGDNILAMRMVKKIDTIRWQIQSWFNSVEISSNLYYFLLASLIESADKVANTASVYGAYLKHLKKISTKQISFNRCRVYYK